MKDYNRPLDSHEPSMPSLGSIARAVGGVFGVVLVLIGLLYVIRIFHVVYNGLQSPDEAGSLLARWEEALGGADLNMQIGGKPFAFARVFAVLLLGGGTMFLGWLSVGLIALGARILGWVVMSRDVVRKVMKELLPAVMVRNVPPD